MVPSAPRGALSAPRISVCVPSHDRPWRLLWLLNALEEQGLAPADWEVVVCHDSAGEEADRVLATHGLARGRLRTLKLAPGTGRAARQRNEAWRAARAPLILFCDDDCRPPPEWLERALAAGERHPGAVIQGATRPDPDEAHLVRAAGWRSLEVDPPTPWGETCNILYPRAVLERLGGFDETFATGEDTDLAQRAVAAGVPWVAAPELLMFHAVEVFGLVNRVRATQRWRSLPGVVARHAVLRERFGLGVFWKPRHPRMLLALAGVAGARRRPVAGLLVVPWALAAAPSYGPGARGRIRAVSELPGAALVDLGEIVALVRGSVEHRTLLL